MELVETSAVTPSRPALAFRDPTDSRLGKQTFYKMARRYWKLRNWLDQTLISGARRVIAALGETQ
ncbi:hypothetical protein, variant [Blastomyces gilchristii SLH14081]|uniref:Uncharacterized protein n=1 Tax=Blastomyces gilchristii (strain SLH14081) TaxID=559298 RepID=A0A179UFD4_BLAGS|nr:uncharacterized protein BDBG_02913 [Blastomyces gilchristii SLH14081]XP_031577385.1 hypothetical protein, variant [Blastomyces gilchristii SLH14081]OAT06745.1 hypothetical protein BDBG_02913 [Blastomyces gilchristii SLH14081]OAT06746.1 hypothetical protein, variant [Blastomyces gilchristii SLH14081]